MKVFRTVPAALIVILVAGGLLYGQKAPKSKTKEERVYFSSEITVEPRITESPEPDYTDEARKNAVAGSVIIRCIFRASGEITDIFVSTGLPHGLTKRAVEAAKHIKFVPAMKKARPVSVWMELEYKFSLDKRTTKDVIRSIT
jgi:TonB family protein